MPARLCNCVVLMTVLVAGTSGMLIPSVVQAKDPMPTFDLDHIIDLALERNPMIAGAQSVIAQSEGRRIEAGAYPNPTITVQTADATLRDPSLGRRMAERNMTLSQPLEWPGKRAARQDAAEAGLAGATVGLEESRLNLIADVKTAFYDLLLAERNVDLLQQNLETVQEVARIVKARVRSG
jgi:outer membrane protein, heavy metal efflux system